LHKKRIDKALVFGGKMAFLGRYLAWKPLDSLICSDYRNFAIVFKDVVSWFGDDYVLRYYIPYFYILYSS